MLLKLEQEPLACLLGQAKCISTVRNTLTRCGVCIHAHGLLVPSAFPTRIRLTSFSLFSKCIPGATCLCIHLGLPLAAICRPAAVKSRPKIKVLHRQRNLCGARDGDSSCFYYSSASALVPCPSGPTIFALGLVYGQANLLAAINCSSRDCD